PTHAVLFQDVVGAAGTHVHRAAGEPDHLLVKREGLRRVGRVQLVPEEPALARVLVGRIAHGVLERADLGPLWVGDPRRPADARERVGRIDPPAAVGGRRPDRRVDVLDRYVRDPVRRLAVALGRGVAADHRVAGIDHVVGLVAHGNAWTLHP